MDLTSYAEWAVRLANDLAPPAELRGLRDELAAVFDAAGDERAVASRLNALLERYPVRPQLSDHDGHGWHLHLADDPAATAVMGLAAVVAELGVDRLGRCHEPRCRRAFLDTSSNRSRRYCSARCASRANVAAYRARRRDAARPAGGRRISGQ
ncbi:CGNR zinc finger domain-containing protein [Nonomuraea sp. NPDC049421]|uniref:CGNR zinc finger domain-containing protein n=1 Tax=unclassified Nonomuraea TaxID=2593643 RepID=UPI0033AF8BF4